MSFIRLAARSLARPRLAFAAPRLQSHARWQGTSHAPDALDKGVIEKRVIEVLKSFEKVNPSKVLSPMIFIRFARIYTSPSAQVDHHLIIYC
jgi:hypothetical protein